MTALPALTSDSLYEQFCALPDHVTGEIINGQLHAQPRPSGRHGRTGGTLNIDPGGPFQLGRNGPGGWWIIPKPEVHFVRDSEVAVPDLTGWRRERMPRVPDDRRFEVGPDWVCEILSPTSARRDHIVKLPFYARFCLAYAWLVDPEAHTLEAFALRQGHWLLIASLQDDAAVRVAPFDAVVFSLADLWASGAISEAHCAGCRAPGAGGAMRFAYCTLHAVSPRLRAPALVVHGRLHSATKLGRAPCTACI